VRATSYMRFFDFVIAIDRTRKKWFCYEESTILLDTDLKIILLDQDNFVGILKIMGNDVKNFLAKLLVW